MNYSEGEVILLYKLWYLGCFSKGRTLYIDNLLKGFPKSKKGELKDCIAHLIKQNILIKIPHRYGYKIYINIEHRESIYKAIKASGMYPFFN